MTSGQASEPAASLQIAESVDAFAKLLSALPGMAYECSVDAPWTLNYVSDGVLSLSGYESGVFTTGTRVWGDVVHPDDLGRIAVEVAAGVAKRRQFTLVYRILCKTGEEKWVLEKGEALYDANGKARSLVGFISDITEQKQIEQKLRETEERYQKELVQASRSTAMETMASTLAHELNQPLTAAMNWMAGSEKLLRRGPEFADKALEGFSHAAASVSKAGEIIRRVRKMLASGEAATEGQYLSPIVDESVFLLSDPAREAGVSCEAQIPKLCVQADPIQLQQVIQNLVRNGIEAMTTSAVKKLNITAKKVKGCAEVSVADTGTGLTAEVRDQLFTPFHSTKDSGLGVGLSLCRTIVEAHSGKIWADENPGGGTIFRFTIPLAEAPR